MAKFSKITINLQSGSGNSRPPNNNLPKLEENFPGNNPKSEEKFKRRNVTDRNSDRPYKPFNIPTETTIFSPIALLENNISNLPLLPLLPKKSTEKPKSIDNAIQFMGSGLLLLLIINYLFGKKNINNNSHSKKVDELDKWENIVAGNNGTDKNILEK